MLAWLTPFAPFEKQAVELRWKNSFSVSSLHAAACIHEGLPVADPELVAPLQPSTSALIADLEACGLDVSRTLPLLTGLAADYENNRQLVEMAVTCLQGKGAISPAAISRLAGCIADLEAALSGGRPEAVDQLSVRSRPLREQWEARGPGLLLHIAKLAGDPCLAPAADVVLVHPWVGGHGRAHLPLNRITFEGVLANAHQQLPETLRLGWLLAQLNFDLPLYSDLISGSRLPRIASLATLPLVLRAAEQVEWASLSAASLEQVLTCWHIRPDLPPEKSTNWPQDMARRLLDWWQAFEDGTTRWPVALAALDHLLRE